MNDLIELDLPPLSVNRAWQGRRFATKEYKDWTDAGLWILKTKKTKIYPPYKIAIDFYQSKLADIDGGIKCLLDLLVKSGMITDDRYIDELLVKKIVSKVKKITIKFY